ncbi:MAG: ABC transporter permease, partial [Robiginitomaculum sp.]|nr:ABC transporter permease [Robiginitomaculum sp.]
AKVQPALDSLTKGRTVFVIAHRLSTVKNADRILVLDDGQIIESGTHAALMKKSGLYAKLRALQFP